MVEVVAWVLLAWFWIGFGVALIVGELLHARTMARDGLQLHLPRPNDRDDG